MATESNKITVKGVCGFPTPQVPWYHVRLTFSLKEGEYYRVSHVKVNGQRSRDFLTWHDYVLQNDQMLQAGGVSDIAIRWDWKNGDKGAVEVTVEGPRQKQEFPLKANVEAPGYGGYWNPAWKHYASFVCREIAGIDRDGRARAHQHGGLRGQDHRPGAGAADCCRGPADRRRTRGALPGPRGEDLHRGGLEDR